VTERKCDECDEKGFREYEGKFRCEKHHSEAKRKANIEFEKKRNSQKICGSYRWRNWNSSRVYSNLSVRFKFIIIKKV